MHMITDLFHGTFCPECGWHYDKIKDWGELDCKAMYECPPHDCTFCQIVLPKIAYIQLKEQGLPLPEYFTHLVEAYHEGLKHHFGEGEPVPQEVTIHPDYIDWDKFGDQKKTLLEVIDILRDVGDGERADVLDGVLTLLDTIGDQAFPPGEEENPPWLTDVIDEPEPFDVSITFHDMALTVGENPNNPHSEIAIAPNPAFEYSIGGSDPWDDDPFANDPYAGIDAPPIIITDPWSTSAEDEDGDLKPLSELWQSLTAVDYNVETKMYTMAFPGGITMLMDAEFVHEFEAKYGPTQGNVEKTEEATSTDPGGGGF